jgi:uncharacterized membrane protein
MMVGVLALAPLAITGWALWAVLQIASAAGAVVALPVRVWLRRQAPEAAAVLETPWVATTLELAAVAALLYLVGLAAGSVLGAVVGGAVARLMRRAPGANLIYGSVQQLIDSFKAPAAASGRVVLIEFPSPSMRAVGFVTKEFTDAVTGQTLLSVYVPTTPNPTSGYVEIVPEERVVWLDWTAQEATQFIMSGGVAGPSRITFDRPDRPPGQESALGGDPPRQGLP